MVDCPACKRSHGKLSPGIYECPCKAQFRVEKNPAKKNPAKKNPAKKNPEELDDYHLFPSWDKEGTWDVLTGSGERGMGGERLGEVTYVRSKGGGGRFQAFRVADRNRATPGFISRSDAIRWVVGELPNPKGKRAGMKARRVKAKERADAAESLRDVKEYAATSAARNPAKKKSKPWIYPPWMNRNPDEPRGYWEYPPVEVGAGDVGHPDRPMSGSQSYFDDDQWMEMLGPDTGSSNGHIADPFTPRRHFGMFTFKGNRAVESFAQRWRDAYLEGRDLDWERDILPELEQLASLPGLEEARDTDVREQIMAYIEEGDKVVEMDGETYHYPHMVTPDYYQD